MERDEGQEGCTFLAALMQKDRRKLKRFGANMLTIGYAIYQVGTSCSQCPCKDFEFPVASELWATINSQFCSRVEYGDQSHVSLMTSAFPCSAQTQTRTRMDT